MLTRQIIDTPFERLELVSDGKSLISAAFLYDASMESNDIPFDSGSDEILSLATRQLEAYFLGELKTFSLPLAFSGTPFQQKVWQILSDIPYGEVLTYKEIASKAGSPKAFRAVGGACRANPFTVIIPCHRVLSTSGQLTGYFGDKTYMKEGLLSLEGFVAPAKKK